MNRFMPPNVRRRGRAGHLFLKLDDDPGLAQLLAQPAVLPFELRDLAGRTALWIRLRPPLAREPGHTVGLSLAPPRNQVRRIQPFPPQQSTDLTRTSATIGLPQHASLVLRCEPPPPRPHHHFRIGNGSRLTVNCYFSKTRRFHPFTRPTRPENYSKLRQESVSLHVDTQGNLQAPSHRLGA